MHRASRLLNLPFILGWTMNCLDLVRTPDPLVSSEGMIAGAAGTSMKGHERETQTETQREKDRKREAEREGERKRERERERERE